jgi:hypothetical protein
LSHTNTFKTHDSAKIMPSCFLMRSMPQSNICFPNYVKTTNFNRNKAKVVRFNLLFNLKDLEHLQIHLPQIPERNQEQKMKANKQGRSTELTWPC